MKTFEFIQTGFFVISIFGTLCGFIYFQILKDDNSFDEFKRNLLKNDPLDRYHGIIKKLLKKSEKTIGKPLLFETYNKILLVSLVYPFFFLLIGYLVSGHNSIGGLQIFPNQPSPYLRISFSVLFIVLFLLVVTLLMNVDRIESYRESKFKFKNERLEIFFSGILPAIVVTGTITLIFVVGILLFNFMQIFAFGVVVLCVVITILLIYDGIDIRDIAAAFVIILGISGFFTGALLGEGTSDSAANTILVILFFFVILPISNSIFDYISFEISRFLTKKTVYISNKLGIFIILICDFVVALALLVGTAYIIPFFIKFYDLFIASIDWRSSAIIAKEEPFSRGLGITLMLFSTLIWTAIHSVIAFGSLVFAPIGRSWILSVLDKENITNIELSIVAFWISLNITLSAICLFFIPWYIVSKIFDIPIATHLYDFIIKFHILF